MASGKQIMGVMIAVVIAATLLAPIVTTVNDSTGTQSVTNETVTADVGSYVALDGYSLVSGSETVYGYNDTSSSYEVATSGTDYEIAYDNGSVKALSGSSLIDDGETVKVSYDYEATDGTTTTIADLVPLLVVVLILATLGMEVQKHV